MSSPEKKPKQITPEQAKVARRIIKLMSRAQVWVYRKSGGRLWNRFMMGSPVCLLTMIGRKSGQKITTPLIYIPHGDDVLLVASQGGMDTHPIWYLNLVANRNVEITVGKNTRQMMARQATDDEKKQLWPVICATHAGFAEYQARTSRNIPVMICSPEQ